jgi:hypothetical protein
MIKPSNRTNLALASKLRQQRLSKEEQEEEEWEDRVVAYLGAAVLTVLVTLTCPGDTALWIQQASSTSTTDSRLDWSRLLTAVVSYACTMTAFCLLRRSDPGYLNVSILANIRDGYTVAGEPLFDTNMACEDTDATGGVISYSISRTRRKFCKLCQIAPPLRSHHCKTCRRCVATFDHHCEFVGNCIGEGNRRLFWWFLASQTVSFMVSVALVESSSIHVTTILEGGLSWKVLRVGLAKLYLYPLTAAAVIMLLIHSLWAVGNATTFEWSRNKHLDYYKGLRPTDWPFSRGVQRNLTSFCWNSNKTWKPTIWQPPNKVTRRKRWIPWWQKQCRKDSTGAA